MESGQRAQVGSALSGFWQQIAQQRAFADVIALVFGDVSHGPRVSDGSSRGSLDGASKISSSQMTEPIAIGGSNLPVIVMS